MGQQSTTRISNQEDSKMAQARVHDTTDKVHQPHLKRQRTDDKVNLGALLDAAAEKEENKKKKKGLPIYFAKLVIWDEGRELQSQVTCAKSSPEAAARHVVRKFVKEMPLNESVEVEIKSSAKSYVFIAVRNYNDAKRRSFTLRRVLDTIAVKKEQ